MCVNCLLCSMSCFFSSSLSSSQRQQGQVLQAMEQRQTPPGVTTATTTTANNKACPTTMTNSRGHTCWRAALLFLFSPFPLFFFFFFSRAQLPGCCSLHRLVTRVFVEAIWTSTGCSGSFVPGGLWAVADAGLLPSYPHPCENISTSHRTPRGTSHLQNGWSFFSSSLSSRARGTALEHGTAGESLEPLMLSEMFLILLMWFSRDAAYARTPRTPPHDHHSFPLVQFCSCTAVVPFFFPRSVVDDGEGKSSLEILAGLLLRSTRQWMKTR